MTDYTTPGRAWGRQSGSVKPRPSRFRGRQPGAGLVAFSDRRPDTACDTAAERDPTPR